MPDTERILETIIKFGEQYGFGRGHGHAYKVRDLALKIFDQTKKLGLHNMGQTERLLLEAAALLHDIGLEKGSKQHHKHAKDIILQSPELAEALDEAAKQAIAWIAFFHRSKPDPFKLEEGEGWTSQDAQQWAKLRDTDAGRVIMMLASMLRIADALDRTLRQIVEDIELQKTDDTLTIDVKSTADATTEKQRAREKSKLFTKTFGLNVEIH